MRDEMLQPLRIFIVLTISVVIGGCVIYTNNPRDWPKMKSHHGEGCIDISGEYINKAVDEKATLADLLIKKFRGWRYFGKATTVKIEQSEENLIITVLDNHTIVENVTLVIGKDVYCKNDGIHMENSGWSGGAGVMVYANDKFIFNLSENSALISEFKSRAIGQALFFPAAGVEIGYYRFERVH